MDFERIVGCVCVAIQIISVVGLISWSVWDAVNRRRRRKLWQKILYGGKDERFI